MRLGPIMIAATASLLIATVSTTPASQGAKPRRDRPTEDAHPAKTKAIQANLDREVVVRIPSRSTLEDALKLIKEASKYPGDPDGIPIYVDPVSLQELKITMETRLDLTPTDEKGPLSVYLNRVVQPLGLAYLVRDGLLTLTSAADLVATSSAQLAVIHEKMEAQLAEGEKELTAMEAGLAERENELAAMKKRLTVLRKNLTDQKTQLAAQKTRLAAIGIAGNPPQKPTAEASPLTLFDGKSLDGWKKTDFFGAGEVKVEGGSILLMPGPKMSGITSTRKDLPKIDYELSYEAKRTAGTDFFAAATFPVGDSFLTFVNGGWGGSITGLSSLNGADASENPTNTYFKYKDQTWYRFRVRVTDAVIRCWIDDKPVVAVEYKGQTVGTRLETRPSQPLGFATWESGGAVRKVEIRRLTPDEVAENNKVDEPK